MNNPIRFIDPDGRASLPFDDYQLSKSGEVTLIKKTDDNFDRVYNEDKSKNIKVDKGVINKNNSSVNGSVFITTNTKQAEKAYKFFSDNTEVEFSLSIFTNKKDVAIINTSHEKGTISGTTDFIKKLLDNPKISLKFHSHSHPGKYDDKTGWPAYPSGFDYNLNIDVNKTGDRNFYQELNLEYPKTTPSSFNIYVPDAPNLNVNYNSYEATRKNQKH